MTAIENAGGLAPPGTRTAEPVRPNVSFETVDAGVNTLRGSWNAPNEGGGDHSGNEVTPVAEPALVGQEP